MISLTGTLINFIDVGEYKSPEGIITPQKAKVQILTETIRKDGKKVNTLHSISIPDTKISQYIDKVSKPITVQVGIISKEYSFYGI